MAGFAGSVFAVDPSTVISGNFDPEVDDPNSMSTLWGVSLVGGFNITIPVGAFEDNSTAPGVPGSNPSLSRINSFKPIWSHAAFFSPGETDDLGRVVLPIDVRRNHNPDQGLRLELWRVDGDRDAPDTDWTYLGSSGNEMGLPKGKQFVNFDFPTLPTAFTLEAGEEYAFHLTPVTAGSLGALQGYHWLANYGVPAEGTQVLWNYNYNVPVNTLTEDASFFPFSNDASSSFGLLDLNRPGMLIQDSSVPEPASLALLALGGLALLRRR